MEGGATDRQEQPEDAATDSPELSYWERLIQHAQKAVEDAPEIRQERVAAVKRALQNGTLNLRGTDLAEKLLREALRDHDAEA
jgi:flagellar biosynthesis anti-sigma factor FlgM